MGLGSPLRRNLGEGCDSDSYPEATNGIPTWCECGTLLGFALIPPRTQGVPRRRPWLRSGTALPRCPQHCPRSFSSTAARINHLHVYLGRQREVSFHRIRFRDVRELRFGSVIAVV